MVLLRIVFTSCVVFGHLLAEAVILAYPKAAVFKIDRAFQEPRGQLDAGKSPTCLVIINIEADIEPTEGSAPNVS